MHPYTLLGSRYLTFTRKFNDQHRWVIPQTDIQQFIHCVFCICTVGGTTIVVIQQQTISEQQRQCFYRTPPTLIQYDREEKKIYILYKDNEK